jgi:PTS system galactitol-specific IIA component
VSSNVAADLLSNLIVIKSTKTSKEEVLQELSDAAIAAGYARPGYCQAILEREAKYPTGLHTPEIEVAVPHADAEWTIKPSLTIAILDEPVIFEPMGGEGGLVNAELVFMLTIEDASEHLDFLRSFSSLMEVPQVLIDFKNSGDPEELISIIREKMG